MSRKGDYQEIEVFSPLKGKIISLEKVNDEAFATKTLGDGIAIIPTVGEVYAPFDGKIATLFPTKHAIGFVSEDGCEVLVHIGFDTVNLNGKYFNSLIVQNEHVVKGQKVLEFDLEKLKEEGYSVETPVVITNGDSYTIIDSKKDGQIDENDCVIKCQKQERKEIENIDSVNEPEKIIELVGGANNIDQLTHCATRLRFVLVDESLADDNQIKKLNCVSGVVKSGGQYQIVIGNEVNEVFKEIENKIDLTGSSENNNNKKKFDIIGFLSGCFSPILPVITGAGMLQAVLAIAVAFGLSSEDATYIVLSKIADAGFYFLPVLLAYTAAEQLKCNKYLAVMLAGVLLHPDLLGVEGLSFLGLSIPSVTYNSSVIPIILGVVCLKYVEIFAEKVSPKLIKFFTVPLITILITAPITLLVLGPLGSYIGNYVAIAINFINAKANWLAVGIMGGIAPLMVMTGMHYAMTPITVQQFATVGYDTLMFPGMLAANAAQGGAAFAVFLKTKNKKMKDVASSGSLMAVLGITEPVMYGVNLKLKKPFIAVMIGGVVGGLFAGIMALKCYAFASAGLASISIFLGTDGYKNITVALITMLISFVVAFAVTMVIGYDTDLEE